MTIVRALEWPDHYLFLFSHMRSYSSVLSHVLGAHPEISGYSESQLKYRHKHELSALRWHVARSIGGVPAGRYLLDKLLHNYMLIPRQLRNSERLRALIFLRRPVETLQSIQRLLVLQPRSAWSGNPEAVVSYYCERVTWIAAVGVLLKNRALAFPAEAIGGHTRELLDTIGAHLDLRTPLTPRYVPGRHTGVAQRGDISPNIHAGYILSPRVPPSDGRRLALTPAMMAQCERAHRRAVALLTDWCPSVGFATHPAELPPLQNLSVAGSGR